MTKQIRLFLYVFSLSVLINIWALAQTTLAAAPSAPQSAASVTYTVNSNDDVTDGFCNSTHCSFREAINAANNHTGPDTILFDFPSAVSILPNSELPAITDQVIIDAVAFSSSTCASTVIDTDLHVSLSGFNAGAASGLRLGAGSSGSTIRGLAVVLFEQDGIEIEDGSDNNTIRCNHIGIDANGNAALPNGLTGIVVRGDNNTIGGDSLEDRNVISGNTRNGILLNELSEYTTVAGNYIGAKADGVRPLGNGYNGILIEGASNTIGGNSTNERNLIADNGRNGILISGPGDLLGSTIINNYIGVDRNGDALGNTDNGVFIDGGIGTTVGSSSAPNLIAYNGENGIRVGETSLGNPFLKNTIRDNELLGIDLQGPGEFSGEVTINDTNFDNDTGANDLQNYPVLSSAEVNGHVQGTMVGTPGDDFLLYFYSNNQCDDSGYGEGATFIESINVTIPGGGVLFLDTTLSSPLTAGKYIVANAYDLATENSSEFSNCVQASEATYVVNSADNIADANPGDAACDITGPLADCTLRAAITEINASASSGPFRIESDIPGAGPHTITPPNEFEDIVKPVTIDATTQPGAACPVGTTPADLQIVLDGSTMVGVFSGSALTLAPGSDGSEIRGLVIVNFAEQGIQVLSDDNVIACNHIGVDQSGAADVGNGLNGVLVSGSGNRIGGLSRSERNVISGNDLNGVLLWAGASSNKLQGNFLGTNASGDSALGNTEAGIRLNGAVSNRIGGSLNTALNVISGNGLYGVHLRAGSNGNQVYGNRIGSDRTGTLAIPNPTGIFIRNSVDNEIGGDAPEKGNQIAGNTNNGLRLYDSASDNLVQNNAIGLDANGASLGNGSHGILMDTTVTGTQVLTNTIAYNGSAGLALDATSNGNSLRYNAVFDNTQLGIDLGIDGPTANDKGDLDSGSNGLQNYPELNTADPISGEIVGVLRSKPSSKYLLDFYRSDVCDPSSYGEGQEYLGSLLVNTNNTGEANFVLKTSGFNLGDLITATATDPLGNTSEFSACVKATSGVPTVTPTATPSTTVTVTPTPSATPTPTVTPTPPGGGIVIYLYLPLIVR